MQCTPDVLYHEESTLDLQSGEERGGKECMGDGGRRGKEGEKRGEGKGERGRGGVREGEGEVGMEGRRRGRGEEGGEVWKKGGGIR